jgi:hypothetical protein
MSDENPARYCIDVILKEARLEDRLAKQLFYVMASAYTNNPLNLAINSPSGEGKNWVIKKGSRKVSGRGCNKNERNDIQGYLS